jgi:hypothetical protein
MLRLVLQLLTATTIATNPPSRGIFWMASDGVSADRNPAPSCHIPEIALEQRYRHRPSTK